MSSQKILIEEFDAALNIILRKNLLENLSKGFKYDTYKRRLLGGQLINCLKDKYCADHKHITLEEFNKYCRPIITNPIQIKKILKLFEKAQDDHQDDLSSSPFKVKIQNIKATIEKQQEKLQQLIDQENQWKQQQDEQNKLEQDYENSYYEFYKQPSKANGQAKSPSKRMSEALVKPFDTVIMLNDLSENEREEMGQLLNEFYEQNIKSQALNTKILVGLLINGSWILRPLDNKAIKASIEKMLAGNYNYTCDEIPTISSDAEVKLSLSFIDGIKFTKLAKQESKKEGQRSKHDSAFFPYRLLEEFSLIEKYTILGQEGCELYDFKNKCINK